VLNYRRGNDPTSVDGLIPVHRGKAIGDAQFQSFVGAFIETLRGRIDDGGDADAIVAAWQALFTPVLEAMRRALGSAPA